jgi:hypothetical protein
MAAFVTSEVERGLDAPVIAPVTSIPAECRAARHEGQCLERGGVGDPNDSRLAAPVSSEKSGCPVTPRVPESVELPVTARVLLRAVALGPNELRVASPLQIAPVTPEYQRVELPVTRGALSAVAGDLQ